MQRAMRCWVWLAAASITGCATSESSSLLGVPGPFGSRQVRRHTDTWTILCLEATDAQRRENTEYLAKGLRAVRELSPSDVRVEHQDHVSRIYYGTYARTLDEKTGMLTLDPKCRQTCAFIRSLTLDDVSPFAMAAPMPMPSVRDDPPEWDLRNAPGMYSLQICYCIDKPGFPDRRDGAVEIVRQLRKEGEEAYYHHGLSKSLVCVGSFDASAVIEGPRGTRQYSPEVLALQNRREEFKYNTEWLQKVYHRGTGTRTPDPSFLVPIPRDEAWTP